MSPLQLVFCGRHGSRAYNRAYAGDMICRAYNWTFAGDMVGRPYNWTFAGGMVGRAYIADSRCSLCYQANCLSR